jgi:hypothetical protein
MSVANVSIFYLGSRIDAIPVTLVLIALLLCEIPGPIA